LVLRRAVSEFGTWESYAVQWQDRGYTAALCGEFPGVGGGLLYRTRQDVRISMSIPNLITLARILTVPVLVWAIISGEMQLAFLLFLAAGISDAVDGFLAKRFGMATELGAFLDPLADKVLIVSIYVALGIIMALPAWLVILVVSRDFMIVGAVILSWLVDRPLAMKPAPVSKLNTVAQILFATLKLASLALGFDAEPVLTILMALVVVLTLLSIGFYLRAWVRHMNSTEAGI
jgi:cardiolipin synthase